MKTYTVRYTDPSGNGETTYTGIEGDIVKLIVELNELHNSGVIFLQYKEVLANDRWHDYNEILGIHTGEKR